MLLEKGSYKHTINLFLGELLTLSPYKGDDIPVLIDIGDDLGFHGLYAAKLGYKTWINEPNERNRMQVFVR